MARYISMNEDKLIRQYNLTIFSILYNEKDILINDFAVDILEYDRTNQYITYRSTWRDAGEYSKEIWENCR